MSPSDGPCAYCGAPGYTYNDPYSREMDGEDVEIFLCDRCYRAACEDI